MTKRHTLKHLPALLCAAALAGCANAPTTNPPPRAVAPSTGVATIVGWGNTIGENASAAMSAEWTTRVTRLYVSFVNGNRTGIGENTARAPAGEPDVIVNCGIYVNHRFFTYDERIAVKLQAGRVYELRANVEGRRCQPYLEDITGKKG